MLHAIWNAVAHGAGDRLVGFGAVFLGERFGVRRAVAAAVVAAGILLVVI
ncbi:hypothetical protein [Actinoplanes sp. NBRC 103695]|nr:hypothetical protein [Actinoplanes sp. NBRC 103695]GLY93358.1 hypothetical protein Acsp02_06140 [Actinoplanes sp. NBRC 103695]